MRIGVRPSCCAPGSKLIALRILGVLPVKILDAMQSAIVNQSGSLLER